MLAGILAEWRCVSVDKKEDGEKKGKKLKGKEADYI
jgi:hypothetical protein